MRCGFVVASSLGVGLAAVLWGGIIPNDDLNALVAYLKTLK